MTQDNYTQEQLDEAIQNAKNEWVEQELNPIISERDKLLQHKPKEKSDSEKAMETKQQELWDKEVALTLKDNGLDKFASVVKAKDNDELNTVIDSLNSVMDEYKVQNAYVPQDHKKNNEYSTAKDSGDTQGMLKSLFGFK